MEPTAHPSSDAAGPVVTTTGGKRPYTSPVLTKHGSVYQLTQKAGSCPSPDLVFGTPKSGSHSRC